MKAGVRRATGKAAILFAAAACAASLAAAPAASAAGRTAVPPNQAPRSAIALAFDSSGSGFAFYRGQDNAVYLRTFRDGTWSGQRRLGGDIVGAPAAAVARNTVIVAARGTDNRLKLRMMQQGSWSPWVSWGGTLTASPAITGGTGGRIDAFIRGADHALWTRALPFGGRLTAWRRLGGHLSTGPAAVRVSARSVSVAAGWTDHSVRTTSSDARWAWTSIGGHTWSTPAIAYIPESNGGSVLIRGYRDGLWAKLFGGGSVSPWRRVGTKQIVGAPTAAGTRQSSPHAIAAVRDLHQVPWLTRFPTESGGWSAFFLAWKPAG